MFLSHLIKHCWFLFLFVHKDPTHVVFTCIVIIWYKMQLDVSIYAERSEVTLVRPRKLTLPEGTWKASLISDRRSSNEANSVSAALGVSDLAFCSCVFADTYLRGVKFFPSFLAIWWHVLKLLKLALPSRLSGSGPLFLEAGVAASFVVPLG